MGLSLLRGGKRDVLKRYGFALVLTGLALLVRGVLPLVEGTSIYQLPIVSVVLSAWYGGRGPGLLASFASATGILYWFIPPRDSLEIHPEYALAFFIYITLCVLLTEFGAGRRRAEHSLQAGEERLRRHMTERQWAEERNERLAAIVDSSDDAILSKDLNGIITTWNTGAERIFGYSAREAIGQPVSILAPPDSIDELRDILDRIRRGERVDHFETVRRRKDGTLLDVSLTVSPILDDQGNVCGASKVARDISERNRAAERLLERDAALEKARIELARVSRLTTLGELTTSIAHEVAQPLSGMISSAGACARWLSAEPPDIAEARSALDRIAADGKRAREVIARIRALAKRQTPRKERLDLNHEALAVLALTARELHVNDIVLRTQLDRTIAQVDADRVQLQQVLINLILNGIEAMSGVRDRPRELTVVSGRDGAQAVKVEVRDLGTGLDPEGTERLFEAFYTTKAEGIGIGLSISRSIIEAHGGRLWARPNEPHGAVLQFSLPVTEEVRALLAPSGTQCRNSNMKLPNLSSESGA